MPHARREPETDVVTDKALATDWQAVGARLRESREAQSLHPSVIAGKLCLSQRQVVAIESGETQPFPSDTTRVWCVRRYATLLGLDWVTVVGVPAAVAPAPETERDAAADDSVTTATRPRPRRVSAVIALGIALAIVAGFFLFNTEAPLPPTAVVATPPQKPVDVAREETVVRDTPPPREVNAGRESPVAPGNALPAEEIRGGDPTKSPHAVFVRSDEPVIVYKRRHDGGEETRLEVGPGTATRLSIAQGEVLRVETPRDARLYYQGRQVPREAIERGAWLRFTPL